MTEENLLERPVLIVGTMRAGTTLLARMLNAHPDLYIRFYETNLVRNYGSRFDPISDKNNALRLLEMIQTETTRNGAAFTKEQMDQITKYLDNNGYSYRNIYLAIALFLFRLEPKKRWGEKYAGDCRDVEYFLDLFPDGQVVHIMRDPRDVYASNKKRTASIENLEPDRRDLMVIDEWKKCYCRASYYSKIYGRNAYLIINYEDLIKDPKRVTQLICEFLHLDWHNAMTDPEKFVSDNHEKWEANTYFDKFSGIGTSTISRYEKFLSPEEIAFVETYLKEELQEMGVRESQTPLMPSLYDTYTKKMRRGFLSAGKYRIALFVKSSDPDDDPLAQFLHHSYHDVTAFTHDTGKRQNHRHPVFVINSEPDLETKFSEGHFDFIHAQGAGLDLSIITHLKQKFNLRLFLTDGANSDPKLILSSDMIIANSSDEEKHYKRLGADAQNIIKLQNTNIFDSINDLYRRFVLKYKILS
jgi:hypothetical protein